MCSHQFKSALLPFVLPKSRLHRYRSSLVAKELVVKKGLDSATSAFGYDLRSATSHQARGTFKRRGQRRKADLPQADFVGGCWCEGDFATAIRCIGRHRRLTTRPA